MTARCFPLVGGRVMRVTRLDGCGRPLYGDCAQVVSDGFVSIAATANIDTGDEINVKNAAGKSCVQKTPCPTLTGYGLDITFCRVDPDLFALLTGQDVVLDPATGDAIGFDVDVDVSLCDTGFALEVWSDVPGVACSDDPTAAGTFGYLVYPFVQGGVFGDHTVENDALSFVISGATTKSGGAWGAGPYKVMKNAAGTPAVLTPALTGTKHLRAILTEVAPPEPSCGCIPLDDPAAPPPTTATAGTPGTWTPSASNRPDNLAALQAAAPAIVASPTSAWTAGQSVVLEDGSEAHWTGTAWAAGPVAGP